MLRGVKRCPWDTQEQPRPVGFQPRRASRETLESHAEATDDDDPSLESPRRRVVRQRQCRAEPNPSDVTDAIGEYTEADAAVSRQPSLDQLGR